MQAVQPSTNILTSFAQHKSFDEITNIAQRIFKNLQLEQKIDSLPLSMYLKAGTRANHTEIHKHPFVTALFRVRLTKKQYAQYLCDLKIVYSTLESLAMKLKEKNVMIGAMYNEELFRTEAIQEDLQALGFTELKPSSAAKAYAEHLESLEATKPHYLVSHFYTRYLGDLSGGQSLIKKIPKKWGATAFYTFEQITDTNQAKEQFREKLNGLTSDKNVILDLVNEASTGFELSARILESNKPS